MGHLLDTCAFLWLVNGGEGLVSRARDAIDSLAATAYLSVLTAAGNLSKAGMSRIHRSIPVESRVHDAARPLHLTLLTVEIGLASHAGTLRDSNRIHSTASSWPPAS